MRNGGNLRLGTPEFPRFQEMPDVLRKNGRGTAVVWQNSIAEPRLMTRLDVVMEDVAGLFAMVCHRSLPARSSGRSISPSTIAPLEARFALEGHARGQLHGERVGGGRPRSQCFAICASSSPD
jgi:hypothetical protein